jgi:methionine aminotransferase
MQAPVSKLPLVGTNIFTRMSALATEVGAINIAQGFPDFPSDPALINLVNKAMQDGFNQYAPMPGLMRLREQISIKTQLLYESIINRILKSRLYQEAQRVYILPSMHW